MNTPISQLLERKGAYVHVIEVDESVQRAVDRMNRHGIGALVVVEGARIAGIFTERDVLTRLVSRGLDPAETDVRDVMSRGVVSITSNATVKQALKVMDDHRCGHLPVVDGTRLCGMVSMSDINRWCLRERDYQIIDLITYITHG